jgi:hypothetical protein
MNLTGKCKKDFDKWLKYLLTGDSNYNDYILLNFYNSSNSMKYGVYVDFFDSVEIHIEMVKHTHYGFCCSMVNSLGGSPCEELVSFKTRPEARTAAIEKANELYNLK